jgi:DNA-3-methyladenine glycosylase II
MMAFTESFAVEPSVPFSLGLSAQIFLGLDRQVRTYTDGMFSQVLRIDGNLVLVKVIYEGTVELPKLRIELASNQPITADTRKSAQSAIEYIFNLNFDLNAFYKQAEKDSVLQKITRQLCGFKYPTTATAFESLVDSIVEQQISIKVARIIEERLAKKFGDTLEIANTTHYAFPTPQNLTQASIAPTSASAD